MGAERFRAGELLLPIPAQLDLVPGARGCRIVSAGIPAPAAGGPADLALDGGIAWALLWWTWLFTASVAVANRSVSVSIGTALGGPQMTVISGLIHTASQVVQCSACASAQAIAGSVVADGLVVPLVPVVGATTLRFSAQNLQGSDTLTNLNGYLVRWE